jgi:hypothetical protein
MVGDDVGGAVFPNIESVAVQNGKKIHLFQFFKKTYKFTQLLYCPALFSFFGKKYSLLPWQHYSADEYLNE